MIFTETKRQRLEEAALVEQEEMLVVALQEVPHTLKLLYKALNKNDSTRARKILGLMCGQMGMVAKHLGAEREADLLGRIWKQLRGGGGAAAGVAGTEAKAQDSDLVEAEFIVKGDSRKIGPGNFKGWVRYFGAQNQGVLVDAPDAETAIQKYCDKKRLNPFFVMAVPADKKLAAKALKEYAAGAEVTE